ncbi:MBL fold metallo-hydrolase [Halovenus sp. HT40]|uniref:MBL fold metallo-hydrolase n=1 Tax=Halovenus sp. HT40 TaxID=3126691 RepID=UPI00300F6475
MVERFSLSVQTRAPTGATNAYVFDGIVVDPAARSDDLDSAIADGVDHVAVTHHHPDHVGAVAEYAREFDLTVWARYGRTDEFESATGIAPDRTFTPGASLPAGDGVSVVDTPGHAPEHTSFVLADGIVTGDLAVAEGSVVVGAPKGDMRAYVSSLRRVHAMNPQHLYPGHGPVIETPRETCERLIAHRLDRERAVEAAIRDGNQHLDDIVEAAYDKDISAVYDLARATVLAHVEKLAVESKITFDGHHARPA